MLLMNPLYNGWTRRHRRSDRESLKPASWLEEVEMARPTGVGRAISTYTISIPIEGRDEWLAAAGLRA
jgi:hypothetical protein